MIPLSLPSSFPSRCVFDAASINYEIRFGIGYKKIQKRKDRLSRGCRGPTSGSTRLLRRDKLVCAKLWHA